MTKFVLLVVGIGLAVILGVYFFGSRPTQTTTSAAMKTTEPVFQLDKTEANLGNMTITDVKSATFNLKNNGSEAIELSHFQSSCNCTSVIVKMGNKISPTFNMPMHMTVEEANWKDELPAGQNATITITYDPSKMPVYGAIERYATFMANSKEVKLTVKANVQ